MWLRARCDLAFDITVPTPFILMLRPRSGAQQWVALEEYTLDPSSMVIEFTDGYGNLCQRLIAQPGRLNLSSCAEVMTADDSDQAFGAPFVEIQHLPESVLSYLLPSRYCESDQFCQMATEITSGYLLGYDQVAAIERWIHHSIRYEFNNSDFQVSAVDVHLRGYGVCRDLAHLAIALCRSISIPARLVVGYLYGLQPMDLHAWFEAYVGGRWYTFDATQAVLPGGYVSIGYGRDAADVAVYNQFVPSVYPVYKHIAVEKIDRR